MVKGTHRAVRQLGGAETSRRGTAPRRQPPHGHGVGRSLTPRRGRRQSPSAVALFLSKKGKHVRREATGLLRSRRVSNATSSRCNMLGSVVLTLDLLRQITNNFSDDQDQLLGEGAFGKVYKGVLPNGDTIAVKRFASTITGLQDPQYENEAQHLMRLEHQNIVQLVGYCSETEMKLVPHNGIFVRAEESERLLCLEYMSKGSLRDHLSDETSGLEWGTRYKIIEGICNGLHCLHEGQATPIIHMDLKPANILLDDNMVPKIADFGLSRLFGEEQTRTSTTSCKGTRGYMPPEYIEKGVITKMFDIFSLGVIIIEIITGLKDYPTDETEKTSHQYIDRVINNWRHRLTKAQGYTSEDIDYQQIKQCTQIGLLCVKFDREKRPTINQIIKLLERSDESYQKEKELRRIDEGAEPPGGGGLMREQSLLEATCGNLFDHIDDLLDFPNEDAPAPGSRLSARIIDVGSCDDMAQLEWLSGLFDNASIPHEPAFPGAVPIIKSSAMAAGALLFRSSSPTSVLEHGTFNNANGGVGSGSVGGYASSSSSSSASSSESFSGSGSGSSGGHAWSAPVSPRQAPPSPVLIIPTRARSKRSRPSAFTGATTRAGVAEVPTILVPTPMYRPSVSPTFVPSIHSNLHNNVVEMRQKAVPSGNPLYDLLQFIRRRD